MTQGKKRDRNSA